MTRCVLLLLIELCLGLDRTHHQQSLLAGYPFYHTSEALSAQIRATRCSVPMSVRSEAIGSQSIDIVDIGYPSSVHKAFYLFGEHARELISPETALQLVQDLCAAASANSMVAAALKTTQFRIIPNGNPASRVRVEEQGQTCLRANERGVDLNRNWDAHWQNSHQANTVLDQVNPGAFAFSETETQIFRNAVLEFQPTIFATIHSGTRGMYMPWAFDKESGITVRNEKRMKSVLAELDAKFCQCPSGEAAAEVGYDSPGTCLDWVHTHTNALFSYAFEIYTGLEDQEAQLTSRYEQQLRGGSFLQKDDPSCFEQFNPKTQQTYTAVVTNWANALVELAVMSK